MKNTFKILFFILSFFLFNNFVNAETRTFPTSLGNVIVDDTFYYNINDSSNPQWGVIKFDFDNMMINYNNSNHDYVDLFQLGNNYNEYNNFLNTGADITVVPRFSSYDNSTGRISMSTFQSSSGVEGTSAYIYWFRYNFTTDKWEFRGKNTGYNLYNEWIYTSYNFLSTNTLNTEENYFDVYNFNSSTGSYDLTSTRVYHLPDYSYTGNNNTTNTIYSYYNMAILNRSDIGTYQFHYQKPCYFLDYRASNSQRSFCTSEPMYFDSSGKLYYSTGYYTGLTSTSPNIVTSFDITLPNGNIHRKDFSFGSGSDFKFNEYMKFNDDSFGVTSNNVVLYNYFDNHIKRVWCTVDEPFDSSGYCNFDKEDFDVDYTSTSSTFYSLLDLSSFKDTSFSLDISSNKYYVFTYRLKNYFNPNLTNFVIDLSNGNKLDNISVDNLIARDNGAYTDYQLIFNTNNVTIPDDVSFESITLFFNVPISSRYSTIDDDFQFSVYNSYKLTSFNSFPTTSQLDNDYYTNTLDYINNSDTSSWFNNFKVDTFGFSAVITAPLRFLSALGSNQTSSCSPLELNFPHTNQTFELPCMRETFEQNLGTLFFIFQSIISGFILYRIGVGYFRFIKSIENPFKSEIEVVDL